MRYSLTIGILAFVCVGILSYALRTVMREQSTPFNTQQV
jgi:hypothetical protein